MFLKRDPNFKVSYYKNPNPREMAEKAVVLWKRAKTKKQIKEAKDYFRYAGIMSKTFLGIFNGLYEKQEKT